MRSLKMKKIIFIGNSPAVVKAIETIRLTDQDSDITVFTLDGFYPYDRSRFSSWIAKDIKEDKVFCKPVDFYQKNKVSVICERKISRINFKKQRLVTEEKDQVSFDICVLCGHNGAKFADIKGTAKTGVFAGNKLTDVKKIIQELPLAETVTVDIDGIEGLNFVAALAKRGKEVQWVVESPQILADILEASTAEILEKLLVEKGIRIFTNTSIAEILGDSDVKAVRLSNKKILAAQMVILKQPRSDVSFLDDEILMNENGMIEVDQNLKTNVPGVFAADMFVQYQKPAMMFAAQAIEEQGQILGLTINGEEAIPVRNTSFVDISIGDMTITMAGLMVQDERSSTLQSEDKNQNGNCWKIFAREEKVCGAILINADDNRDKFLNWIKQKAPVADVSMQISLQNTTPANATADAVVS